MEGSDARGRAWTAGPLSILAFLALMAACVLLIKPFAVLGRAGYLLYGALCLGGTVWTMLAGGRGDGDGFRQAWIGAIGGMLAWTASEMATLAGGVSIEGADGLMLFAIAAALALPALLGGNLRVGQSFAVAIFLMNWGSHLLLKVPRRHAAVLPGEPLLETLIAAAALAGIAFAVYWSFAKARSAVGRLWSSAWSWMLLTTVLYVVKG